MDTRTTLLLAAIGTAGAASFASSAPPLEESPIEDWYSRFDELESFRAVYFVPENEERGPGTLTMVYEADERFALKSHDQDGSLRIGFLVENGSVTVLGDELPDEVAGWHDSSETIDDASDWIDEAHELRADPDDDGPSLVHFPTVAIALEEDGDGLSISPSLQVALGEVRPPFTWWLAAEADPDLLTREDEHWTFSGDGFHLELDPDHGLIRRIWIDEGDELHASLESIEFDEDVSEEFELFEDAEEAGEGSPLLQMDTLPWLLVRMQAVQWLLDELDEGLDPESDEAEANAWVDLFASFHAPLAESIAEPMYEATTESIDAWAEGLREEIEPHRGDDDFDEALQQIVAKARYDIYTSMLREFRMLLARAMPFPENDGEWDEETMDMAVRIEVFGLTRAAGESLIDPVFEYFDDVANSLR
ncbi:MAG: hypothetical protein ACYSWX_03555 [Planctomycetota bacterium]|jgi:hypothetical protein